ncbi:hypothetical protein [Shewanella gaetbuli]
MDHSSGSGGIISIGGSTGSDSSGSDGNGGSGSGTNPTDPPKTSRQICLENVEVRYTTCKAQASSDYSTFLSTTCSGEGSVSMNGGTPVFNGTISIDQYNQCKDIAESRRNNQIDVCAVGKATQTTSCP